MKRTIGRLAILLSAALLTGCVERKFIIESVPTGATVLHNGHQIGQTPVIESFVYHGYHDFTLIKDGYETLHVREKVRAPWYEYPGLDFFFENIIPYKFHDTRRLRYQMAPLKQMPPDNVLHRATDLRQQGRHIGDAPLTPPPGPPPRAVVGAPTTN